MQPGGALTANHSKLQPRSQLSSQQNRWLARCVIVNVTLACQSLAAQPGTGNPSDTAPATPSAGAALTDSSNSPAPETETTAPKGFALIAQGHGEQVRSAWLVGAGGEVFAPVGRESNPAQLEWQRVVGGGCTATPTSVWKSPGDGSQLLLSGISAPLFRWHNKEWSAQPVGQKGRTTVSTGTFNAAAVGKHVFAWRQGRPMRVASLPLQPNSLWANSEKRIIAATAKGVWRLTGNAFTLIAASKRLSGGTLLGEAPFLIGPDYVLNLATGQSNQLPGRTVVVGGDVPAMILQLASGAMVVTTVRDKNLRPLPNSIKGQLRAIASDTAGNILVLTDAEVWLWDATKWNRAQISDVLPVKSGPGPALTN